MLLLVAVLGAAAGLAGYRWLPGRQPAPAQAVAAAAAQLAAAPGMSYVLNSQGDFALQLAVDWRARPRLMRVSGEVRSGSNSTAVSYWVDGDDLYVRDPGSGVWRMRRGGAGLPEVTALLPVNLATRMQAMAAGAKPGGRVRTETGDTLWAYDLPEQGRLLLRQGSLAPVLWRSALEGGGSLEVRWYSLAVPPGLMLPASVQRDAKSSP